jgi:shikimate 5-dehydrogenase
MATEEPARSVLVGLVGASIQASRTPRLHEHAFRLFSGCEADAERMLRHFRAM